MAQLLSVSWYRTDIMRGLVFSIGGVDGSLADAAAAVLQRHCTAGRPLLALSPSRKTSATLEAPPRSTAGVRIRFDTYTRAVNCRGGL